MAKTQEETVEALITEYSSKFSLYRDFSEKCKELIEMILDAEGLTSRVHSVSCRPKEIDKLREKCRAVNKAESAYAMLNDVTDLAGVRVTTFFADDVDKVGAVLEREFAIDKVNSIDKRRALAPDRFGYLSVHYVCRLPSQRAELTENKRFASIPVEIQVRSILQHAWAEIEHDLGYKTPEGIPAEARRRFSRLAGLLELADDEFVRLREELRDYASEIAAIISSSPQEAALDRVSLEALILNDPLVRSLEHEFAHLHPGADYIEDLGHVEEFIRDFGDFGLMTIGDVQRELLAEKANIRKLFLVLWPPEGGRYHPAMSLMALYYALLGREKDIASTIARREGGRPEQYEAFAQKLRSILETEHDSEH